MSEKDVRDIAGDLAVALARKGLPATCYVTGAHRLNPCVAVPTVGGPAFVYVAPADDGIWHYWWAGEDELSILAPHSEPGRAAELVMRELLGLCHDAQ